MGYFVEFLRFVFRVWLEGVVFFNLVIVGYLVFYLFFFGDEYREGFYILGEEFKEGLKKLGS